MISNQEFQQKLQAGQIHEALALLVRDASELDITTQIAADPMTSTPSVGSEYLRTKINLLTGSVHNEVGKDLVTNHASYLKLQQLHVDRIVASHQMVQSYLHQIKAILTVLSPTPSETRSTLDTARSNRLNSASLTALLAQSMSRSIDDPHPQQPDSIAESTVIQSDSARLSDRSHQSAQTPARSMPNDPIEQQPLPLAQPRRIANSGRIGLGESIPPLGAGVAKLPLDPFPVDDDIDLSIDEEGEVWEEWVEDEGFGSEPLMPQPLASTIPNWQDRSIRSHLNPIDVKPNLPRATTESVDFLAQWDKFEPEYIGISTDPQQPQLASDRNSPQMDRLLADLDI
jgi:hypothetical protein